MDRILVNLNGFTQFAIASISLIAIAFHVRWTRRATILGPTILTTLGIFFCFSGIAWGLLDFDPRDIRSSVPHLLEGIRTSFWASVFGIGWALTLKIRVALFGEPKPRSGEEGSTVADLARQLGQLNRAVAGEDESALLGQIKRLRGDSNARLDHLRASFDRHSQTVVEANAKALVAALSEVVRNYNILLNEQVGDNFQRLNTGVERLVAWQVHYQEQLKTLIEQETATRNTMTESAQRYAQLVSRSSEFVAVAESLKRLMAGLNSQTQQLDAGLRGLSEAIHAHQHQLTAALAAALEAAHPDSGAAARKPGDDGRKQPLAARRP